eukprot:TRINITY_DN28209_c0_g2_i1.p1 TRINITY_DN28209_c0_g2~~TRINITY_DN28209_c0_g2_i1.p1  ORF type:complete len:241 (+),score=11.43 TRINITY_DN28209_c0_g2_i1:91-813(+)
MLDSNSEVEAPRLDEESTAEDGGPTDDPGERHAERPRSARELKLEDGCNRPERDVDTLRRDPEFRAKVDRLIGAPARGARNMKRPASACELRRDGWRCNRHLRGAVMVADANQSGSTRGTKGSAKARPQSATSGSHQARQRFSGPERFFYDKSSYTGTHKSKVENREHVGHVSGSETKERLGSAFPFYSPMFVQLPDTFRGPERFFYDKATYTGTHRYGGPARVASGKFRYPPWNHKVTW